MKRRVLLFLLLACGPVDVVVADLRGPLPGPPCFDQHDCDGGTFCDLRDCTGSGECVPVPMSCEADLGPAVCGCDGVRYGNDCERKQAEVSRSPDGC